jgi:predicted outer membrane protein
MAAFMAGGARADTTVDAGQRLKKDHMTEPIRGALWAALVGAMTFALNEPPVSTAVAAASPRESLFTPRELVGTLHRVDEIELEAGKMAERSGGTQAMRDYGATLQHDSVAAAERLKRYARRHHIPVEANPPFGVAGELARARGELDNLENLGGASFDREFAEMMVRDHSKALLILDRARRDVTDPDLKALLDEVEPNLREHEQLAANLLRESSSATPADPARRPRAHTTEH